MSYEPKTVASMLGKTLTSVTGAVGDEEIVFAAEDGSRFRLWYDHDCCASCNVTDICGDLADLVGSPLLQAEEVIGETAQPDGWKPGEYDDSYTWTFYKFATVKGRVTIRWYGSSNGYYSESVSFEEVAT